GVNEETLDPVLIGHPQEGIEVFVPGVHPSMGYKAHQVKRRSGGSRCLYGVDEGLIAEEAGLFDCCVDSRNVHPDYASSANIQMPDFTITHLSVRQPDSIARALD